MKEKYTTIALGLLLFEHGAQGASWGVTMTPYPLSPTLED